MYACLLRYALVAGVLFLLLALLSPIRSVTDTRAREVSAKNLIVQLVLGLEAYKTDYNDYPHGTQAEIIRILRGDNPHKAIYFDAVERAFNEKGELVDPWRTPYKIDLDAKKRARVSSAGKNKVFDGDATGSDDIRSWD